MAVIYIVVLIGVLVFVHECGHYVVARLFGVKVLSFSIGFGPCLFGFKRGETSWDVRALPLGGYVMMYGTEFEEVTDREILYFYAPELCESEWHETQSYVMTVGGHRFFEEG